MDNSIVKNIAIVSIMGGSITGMGIRHFFSAEFNFFLDAQSAKIVVDVFDCVNIEIYECSDRGFWFCTWALTERDKPTFSRHEDWEGKIR